jgi:predicted TIM-barrel fold metal-dependent hydrolase
LNERYPDRIVPTTVSGDGKLWHSTEEGFLDRLATAVRSGRYFAMGEFEARHYYAGPSTSPDAHTRVDSEAMKVVFELSKEKNIPFLLHHEAEDKLLPELELMLERYPEAKVIWCHVGRNRNPNTWKKFRKTEAVREFLKKYPNLYFNFLASPPGTIFSGYVEGIMYKMSFKGVTLDPQWKKVIEEFPDRFVLGSDVAPLRFEGWYDRVFNDYRNIILQGVRKDVAEMIAYKNAWKLMTGEDWVD